MKKLALLLCLAGTVHGMNLAPTVRQVLQDKITNAFKCMSKEPINNFFIEHKKLKLKEEDYTFLASHVEAKAIERKTELIIQSDKQEISQSNFSMLTSQLDDLHAHIIEYLNVNRASSK